MFDRGTVTFVITIDLNDLENETSVLTAGRSVVELDAEGELTSVTNMGFEQDLCVALAG